MNRYTAQHYTVDLLPHASSFVCVDLLEISWNVRLNGLCCPAVNPFVMSNLLEKCRLALPKMKLYRFETM